VQRLERSRQASFDSIHSEGLDFLSSSELQASLIMEAKDPMYPDALLIPEPKHL
jgi:hypothetical protein